MSATEALRPKTRQLIKNLVSAAGLDTREWKKPDNPKFCYEWSFVESEKIVVNLAYRRIVVQGGRVLQRIDLPALKRDYADGNTSRMRRLDRLAQALDLAYRRELPIRGVIFDGDLANNSTSKPTKVSARELDSVPWAVTSCDLDAGIYTLTRGASPERFVDQFTVGEADVAPPERRTVVTQAFERSADVRRRARQRANGKCEFCGQVGFATPSGAMYLETHHIHPLCEGGPDSDDNVIALCANHHREAHWGGERAAMRNLLYHRLKEPAFR
jgi:hypothetical protein